ncbi:hypothetical protein BOTBODRAFT_111951 [Botryobasidium botryosum FD-172 SS1]|uniref:Cytochrome P450 n=1 Tax=Botryobasidium botryosum (strain FD-172 SS1) TaxID=930990 RepID=A0A067MN53_BOTB1|nr:hypothetical protein BOTBODRAFT_111951 [Botryobasidium botryosum FD-172 SS1]
MLVSLLSISFLSLVLATCAAWLYSRTRTHARLPPGPPGHWLFGNKVPHPHAWLTFEQWRKVYGDVFSLRLGSQTLVVVAGYQANIDLMEKQAAYLDSRPRSIAAGAILSGGMRTLLMPSGNRLRRLRKALHGQLQPKAAATYEPMQTHAAHRLMHDILEDPSQFREHIMNFSAIFNMSLAYGKPASTTAKTNPDVLAVTTCLRRLGHANRPGAYWVDSFPLLYYVPWYGRQLKRWHQEELALFRGQLDRVHEKMINGTETSDCFAKQIIEKQAEYGLSDNEAAYLAGSLFGAGADATDSAISILVLAMACWPEATKKAQSELDRVVGRDRMPSFADRSSLPYIEAFILETYRWRGLSFGGVMHAATKDVIWNDHVIPKGSLIISNHWSIHMDKRVFSEPEKFMPERWLKNKEQGNDIRLFVFGEGRRVCPGQVVSERSLFIVMATLLWSFHVRQDPFAPIDASPERFTDTVTSHALPYSALFEARDNSVPVMIENSLTDH